MIRRYNLTRSDNYVYTGRVSYVCSGNGTLPVYTGFPVVSALVSWVTYPFAQDEEMSSSSESSSSFSSSSSSIDSHSSSSSSSVTNSESSMSESSSSESSGNSGSSSSESSVTESVSFSSSTSSQTEPVSGLPRLYVYSYTTTGFVVAYENIPPQVGYIEFEYSCE